MSATTESAFEAELARSWPPQQWCNHQVVVAVSGGSDSVALLRGLIALRKPGRGRLIVAHYNHRLRGAQSDNDQRFVSQLAAEWGVDCELDAAEINLTNKSHAGQSLEALARDQRYNFLLATAHRLGARFVATAHTRDDQVETILHNVLRGAGLAGLAGMPRARTMSPSVTLLRPLLELPRALARTYLTELGQMFCDDASNLDFRFTRNRIRHELLPYLAAEYNPRIDEALIRLGQLAAESEAWVSRQAEELLDRVCGAAADGTVVVNCADLSAAEPLLVRALFRLLWRRQAWPQQSMTHEHWQRLGALAQVRRPEPSAINLPANILARRQGDQLVLRTMSESPSGARPGC